MKDQELKARLRRQRAEDEAYWRKGHSDAYLRRLRDWSQSRDNSAKRIAAATTPGRR